MPNSLQDTVNYVVPFCRYMPANIGTSNMPIIGIANIVRNIILAAPFTWSFNRNTDDSITTTQGIQDYPSSILDFGFLEKTTVKDTDGKLWELEDVLNNISLGKSTTQARPEAISVESFASTPLAPTLASVIKASFTFSDFTNKSTFSFTVPKPVVAGDTLAFALEMSNGTGAPASITESLGNVITQISSQVGAGGGSGLDDHQFMVYNMPITVTGTSVITIVPPTTSSDTVSAKLATASKYALLAAAGISNTGTTLITGGNIGSFPTTTITGFTGTNFTPPAAIDNGNAATAQADALVAYNFYSGLVFTSLSASSANLSVLGNGANASTYTPGNYSAGTSMDIPTNITLDAQGNPNAIFVFKAGSTLTLESGASILLANGAQAGNVVWLVGSSATTVGTTGVFNGNILANTSITIGGGTFNGRALAGIVTSSGAIVISTAVNLTVVPTTPSADRNFLVEGALLTGVGLIQLTSPVNSQSTGTTWTSQSLTTTQPNEILISFSTAYAPPASVTDTFTLLQSGVIPDSALKNVQLSTAGQMAATVGVYTSSWTQASSAQWQQVLIGYPTLPGLGNISPIFRFSAVPNKAYPVNLIYQKKPVQFITMSDLWSPIPDSFSDVYNNLCLGYYMESCQDPRAPQYIARGIAGLLSRAQGLSTMDKALFAASYLNFSAQQMLEMMKTQQGQQAQGAR